MTRGTRLVAALICAVLTLSPATATTRRAAPILASSWLVVDVTSGDVLAERDADRARPAASTQKMLTALVVMERIGLEEHVRISREAARAESDRIMWPEGRQFTVEQMLYGLLLESSNGAAIALAQRVAGSSGAFAALMNIKAASLGATASHFVNPSGLDAPGQASTARDLSLIGRALLKDPVLARIVQTRAYAIQWPSGLIHFYSIDQFLYQYPWGIGVKSGFTTGAGNCLVAAAKKNGRTVMVVLMNSPKVTDEAKTLMEDAFKKLGPGPVTAEPEVEAPPPPKEDLTAVAEPVAEKATDVQAEAEPVSSRRPSRPGMAIVALTMFAVGTLRVREKRGR